MHTCPVRLKFKCVVYISQKGGHKDDVEDKRRELQLRAGCAALGCLVIYVGAPAGHASIMQKNDSESL